MTSAVAPGPVPDVNLTLYWATENDLVDASVAAVQSRLPEWNPIEGNTEVVLLEGVALQVAQEVFTLNQLPRVVFEAILSINGLTRQAGVPTQTQIALTTSTGLTSTLNLPKGSRFRVSMPDGSKVDYLTLSAQTIPVGAVDYPVWAECTTPGIAPRAIAAGTAMSGVGTPTWIERVKVAVGGITGGADPETDEQFWTRGAALLRRRPSSLVTAQNFADGALEDPRVERAAAWSLWDGTGDKTQLGTDLGHVTVAVTDSAGHALTAPIMTEVRDMLAAQAQAGLTVHVIQPFYTVGATVTLTVLADPGVNVTTLKAGLEADLQAWLSPASWPWGTAITTNALIIRAGRYPGVAAITATGGTAWTGPSTQPQGLFNNTVVTATVTAP